MESAISKSDREMLKAVYRLTKGGSDAHTGALAEHLSISPGTVTATVKRLAERDLVDHRPYKGVELTRNGRRLAIAAIRRHRIVERFLSDMLGYAWNEADQLAGAFEHELPQEIEDRLFEKLNRPTTCPHGFPIPGPETDRIQQVPSLYELLPGDTGVVALSGATTSEIVEFLDTLGIRPGATVEVIEKHPFDGPVVVRVEGVDRTVGERLAEKIFVKSRHLMAAESPADEGFDKEVPGRPEREPVDARKGERLAEAKPDHPNQVEPNQFLPNQAQSNQAQTVQQRPPETQLGHDGPTRVKRKDISA